MIKEPTSWEIECDDCGEEFPDAFEFHGMDVDDVIAAVESEGWVVEDYCVGSGDCYCPECAKAHEEEEEEDE